MSLLLDALRRAGASRGDGVVEPLAERAQGRGTARRDAGSDPDRPGDLPSLDVEPLADDNDAADQRQASAPSGPARAEAVFRGGASGRPVLRTAGLGVLGAVVAAGVLAGGAWYYYEMARSEVDRELVRYTPETTPAEPAAAGAASGSAAESRSSPSATADPDGTATTTSAGGAQASTGADSGTGNSTPGEPASPASGDADSASSKPDRAADTSGADTIAEPADEATGAAASGSAAAGASATADTDSGADSTRAAGAGAERAAQAGGGSASTGRASAQADTPETAGAASGGGSSPAAGQQEPMVRTSESGGELGTALRAGYRALRNGDLAAAQRHYQRALDLAPANRDARLGAAAVAQRRGDDALAAKHYRRVLADYPRDPYARAGLASVEGTADPRRSESSLKGLLKENPEAHALRFSLGNLYAREGRWADAQSAYFEAFRDAPREADYAFNLAVALDQLGQRESAITYYERAIELAGNGSASFPVESARRRLDRLQP